MNHEVKISVVVPCLNAEETLALQLDALGQQTEPPWEVIVADNGSSDRSRDIARAKAAKLPRFKLVDASDRRGASHARNVGARASSGDVLAFCDADDEVAPEWIAGLLKALLRHDFVGSRFDLARLNPDLHYHHPQENGLIKNRNFDFLPRVGGSGLAIKRRIHDAVCGFDEEFISQEDDDYCWRVQLTGTELAWAPEALLHVRLRSAANGAFHQARTWGVNEVRLYKRYRYAGMTPISNRAALGEWKRLPMSIVRTALGRQSPTNLAWRLGTRIGHLQGSILCRVLLL